MDDRLHDLLVRGGTCVLPGGPEPVDLAISGGKIVAVGALAGASAERELDARGLHVLPGVVDIQAQLRDDGAAGPVLGGTTAVLDLPGARPHTAAALEDRLSRARGRAHCDFACLLSPAADHLDELDRLERLPGCAGLLLSLGADDELLHRALSRGFRRVTAVCEPDRADMSVESGAAVDLWRDDIDGPRALQRFLNLARRAGRRVHLQRVRGADALALLVGHRDIATLACAAHHLDAGDPDAAALWQAVRGGLVDALASDPADPQLLLAQALGHVHAGRLTLAHAAELLSAGPARIYNLARKGRIALGFDADLVLCDLAAEHTHAGVRRRGWPVATVVRGELVAREGRLLAPSTGAPLRFSDTLRMVVL